MLFLLSAVILRPPFPAFDPSLLLSSLSGDENFSFILRITCDVPSDMFPNTSFILLLLLCEEPPKAPNTPSDFPFCTDCRLGIVS